MFPLLFRPWYPIGVYERRECEMWWKKREWEREGLLFVPMTLLCCSEVTAGASKTPCLKVFFLSSSSHPSLRPRSVSCIPSLHHCRTITTFLCADFYLPRQWTLSPPVQCISLSLTITVHILLSFLIHSTCRVGSMDWLVFGLFNNLITSYHARPSNVYLIAQIPQEMVITVPYYILITLNVCLFFYFNRISDNDCFRIHCSSGWHINIR